MSYIAIPPQGKHASFIPIVDGEVDIVDEC